MQSFVSVSVCNAIFFTNLSTCSYQQFLYVKFFREVIQRAEPEPVTWNPPACYSLLLTEIWLINESDIRGVIMLDPLNQVRNMCHQHLSSLSSLFTGVNKNICCVMRPEICVFKNRVKMVLIQSASVNRAILQHCFFLVRQHWGGCRYRHIAANFKPLNPELNPICYLLALLGAQHFLHVSRIRVKLLTLRRLMSYIWSTHS